MNAHPTRPVAWSTNGIVATPHYLASQAGLRILQDGGSAVDAAIATNAVLQVVWGCFQTALTALNLTPVRCTA